jgi:hypothetical protein
MKTSPIKQEQFFTHPNESPHSFTHKLSSEGDTDLKETIDVLESTHRFG